MSVTVSLETREVLAGGIGASSQRLLLQWMEARAEELAANWQLARDAQPLRSIEPLQ